MAQRSTSSSDPPARNGARARLRWAGLGVLLLIAGILLAGNGVTDPFDRDEARFALAVREMRERADWILPTNFGEPRYHKPILAYWTARIAEEVFGAGPFAWRLPSALWGVGCVAATMALARRRFGARVALRAGAVLGTTLVFVVECKVLTADAALLGSTTLAYWAWWELRERASPRWRFVWWTAIALGLLAKGVNVAFLAASAVLLAGLEAAREREHPLDVRRWVLLWLAVSLAAALPRVGALGPLGFAALGVALLVRARRASPARARLGAARGIPWALLLVGLWLVPAVVRSQGAFLSEGLGHHMLERTARPFEGHRGLPGYYVATGVLVFFPWAGRFYGALVAAWRDPRYDFCVAWALGPFALLECMASKLPHYVLACAPALSILLALRLERGDFRPALPRLVERALFLLPCLALAGGAAYVGLRLGGDVRAGALALAAVLAVWAAVGGRSLAVDVAGAATMFAVLTLWLLPAYEPLRLTGRIEAALRKELRPDEPILSVSFRPASLGCVAPAGHALVQADDEIRAALEQGTAGLFLVPARTGDPRFVTAPGTRAPGWDEVARVSGLDGLEERELWMLRRSGD